MTIEKAVVRSLLFPFVITVTACSPYIYKEEVGKFQDGVAQASKMLDSQKEFLSKRGLEINRSGLLKAKSPRLVVPIECAEAVICLETIAYSTSLRQTCQKPFVSTDTNNAGDMYKTVYKKAISVCGINAEGKLPIEIPAQLPAQRKVMSSLDNYAKALAGIVDAEDKNALSASASKACSSTQQLYSAASNIKPRPKSLNGNDEQKQKDKSEKEGKAITAVCGLVTEIGAAILDRRRLKVLSQVVKESNSKVHLLATYLAKESRKVDSIVLRNKLDRLATSVGATVGFECKAKCEAKAKAKCEAKAKATKCEAKAKAKCEAEAEATKCEAEDKEYLASIDSAVTEKDKFMSALKNNAEKVFLSMAEAHNKLKEALDDPKTQLETAIESIEKFHKVAKDAHEAIKALSDNKAAK